jgi:glyoxylase-like metal-dependent hydrolase (beta-lactamase superfamily II)
VKTKTGKFLFAILITAVTLALSLNEVIAQNTPPNLQQAGYYHMVLGKFKITALSDGTTPQKLNELLQNAAPGEIERLLRSSFQSTTIECSVNGYLINTGTKLILIDAGTSDVYGPALGHLAENLVKAGYKPEQIDAVLLTHIHMDHMGGIMNGNNITFPNADIYISKPEADYYLNPLNKDKALDAMKRFFEGAEMKLRPIEKAGKLKTFEYDQEIFPGIKPVASYGHTPGHSFFLVESDHQRMLFWGDIVVSDAVQFANPAITSVYDHDSKAAATLRKQALADAAQKGYWVAVSHMTFPGIGHITQNNTGYRLVPINYSNSGIGQ